MRYERRRVMPALLAVMVMCAVASPAWAQSPPVALNAREQASAAELAEAELVSKGFKRTPEERIYLIGTEEFRDKERAAAGRTERLALVTHYRYEGDLTILTVVDLTTRTILSVEKRPHQPVGLAPAELKRAKELALADAEVRKALGPQATQVVVEALVIRAIVDQDPYFGRRVVRLLFKAGADYLSEPIVHVDLTAGKVEVLTPPADSMPHH